MPRSSKHKSGKHGSREYSDSERDSGLKDHRKGKDENDVAKTSRDSVSGEKRKLDSKDGTRTGNGDYLDEYSSSKRSKERSGDGGSGGGGGEWWTGGEDGRGERSKKATKVVATGDSMSRRRDESVGMYGSEVEEVKKSGGKHRKDSGRKDSREGTAVEKERKVKEGRSERSVDNEEQRMSKQNYKNTAECIVIAALSCCCLASCSLCVEERFLVAAHRGCYRGPRGCYLHAAAETFYKPSYGC